MAHSGADAHVSTRRRTLVRGAAWSVPVVGVAVTAPSYAASPCDTQAYRLDWGTSTYQKNALTNVGTATVNGSAGGGGLQVTLTSTAVGVVSRANDNLTVSTETNIGNLGAGERGLNIAHNEGILEGRRTGRRSPSVSAVM